MSAPLKNQSRKEERPVETLSPVLAPAYEIAVAELRACYDEFGIVAGRHHYNDYWTRDAAFAWSAALELGDWPVVQRHLEFLSRLQRKDGMVPFLIRRYLSPFAMLGIKIKIPSRPKFRSHKALFLSEVIDSNPWFAIGLADLVAHTQEASLLAELIIHLYPALDWCLGKVGRDGLVKEGIIAGWNDGILKSGRTLLNNVIFYQAFRRWGALDPDFSAAAQGIKGALQRDFFNGRYFIDWIDRRPHDYFDSNANFLAILWGVANQSQAERIIDFAFENLLDPPLVKLVHPRYRSGLVDPANRFLGVADYSDGRLYWLDTACLFVLALEKMGRKREAEDFLLCLANLIVKHQGVYEIYDREFQPVRRWNCRAEHPFVRSAGLFVLACRSLDFS
jgi:hypothetical protein